MSMIVCPKCRGEGKMCVSCLCPTDTPGCTDAGIPCHPASESCSNCEGKGMTLERVTFCEKKQGVTVTATCEGRLGHEGDHWADVNEQTYYWQ